MRVLSRAAVVVALALGVSASAQQPGRSGGSAGRGTPPRPSAPSRAPAPPRDAPVPFQVGETLTYDVAWSNYLVAGSAVSRVVEKRPASNSSGAYYIVAEGRPLPLIARIYALYYKMDSLID